MSCSECAECPKHATEYRRCGCPPPTPVSLSGLPLEDIAQDVFHDLSFNTDHTGKERSIIRAALEQAASLRLPKLVDDDQRLIYLAISVIRDFEYDWPTDQLAAKPEELCRRLAGMLGKQYDFVTCEFADLPKKP